jgi:uncharacterized glyoxalase superfamily protein PhnB
VASAQGNAEEAEAPVIRDFVAYLCVDGAADAIALYHKVFGATQRFCMDTDEGRIGHAELAFGAAVIMISDEYPEMGIRGPVYWGGTPVRFHLHVDEVDGLARRAKEAGATILRGPRDEPHGEGQCLLRDPWGHEWLLGDG